MADFKDHDDDGSSVTYVIEVVTGSYALNEAQRKAVFDLMVDAASDIRVKLHFMGMGVKPGVLKSTLMRASSARGKHTVELGEDVEAG